MKKQRRKIPYLWISLAEEGHSLGVILIRARDLDEAVPMILALGIVPEDYRGQVAAIPCPSDFSPPEEATNRLLTKEDVQRLMPSLALCNGHGEKIQ